MQLSSAKKKMSTNKENNIKNIVSSFSNIDKKIFYLQKSSAQDFKKLYNLTKETYNYTKKINQKTTSLFDQFDYFNNKINKDFKQEIDSINNDFENYVVLFKMSIINNINILETLLNNTNLLFSPLNKLNKDLLDLFFFLTQLKLRSFLSNNEFTLNDEIKNLDNEIANTKSKYNEIVSDINLLKANISGLIQNTTDLSDDLSSFEEFLSFIKLDINNINRLKEKAEKQYSLFKNKSDQSLECLDIIITNLQYQDIIHQKMQHVQETYNQIVDELKTIINHPNKKSQQNFDFKHLPQLSTVVKIQTNQLLNINKDYRKTISIINNNLSSINNNLSSIKTINLNFFYEYLDYKKNTLYTFNKNVKKTSGLLINLYNPDDEIYKQLSTIKEATEKTFKHFDAIKSVYSKLCNEINSIDEKDESSIEPKGSELSLTNQIQSKNESIDNNIVQIEKILTKNIDIINNLNFNKEDTSPEEVFKFLTRLNNLFNKFYEINEDSFEVKDDNSNLFNELIANLEDITKNIKDYSFFEETINSINDELNSISSSIINFNLNNNEKTEYFENYSTKEEREVHDNVINNKNNIEDELDNTENDVEFF